MLTFFLFFMEDDENTTSASPNRACRQADASAFASLRQRLHAMSELKVTIAVKQVTKLISFLFGLAGFSRICFFLFWLAFTRKNEFKSDFGWFVR